MKKLILIALSLLITIGLVGCTNKEEQTTEIEESISRIEELYPGILDKGYLVEYKHEYDSHPDLDFSEYFVAKLYDVKGDLGMLTCMQYNITNDGKILLSLIDLEPESTNDFSDYYKDLKYIDKTIVAKLHPGFVTEDDNQEDEDYWFDATIDLSKLDAENSINIVATGKEKYSNGDKLQCTLKISLTAYDSLQDAYDKCKELDTENEYQ